MRYKVSLENLYSRHIASPWLSWQPTLVITCEDGMSWWLAEDFFTCTGVNSLEILSCFEDDYVDNRHEELVKLC